MKTRLAALAFFAGCQLMAQPVEIVIQLLDYDPAIHKNFIEYELSDANYLKKTQLQLLPDGTIAAYPVVAHTQEITISYDGQDMPIVVSPGDKVRLQIPINDLLQHNTTKARVTGTYQASSTLILKHLQEIEEWLSTATNAFIADKSLPERDYAVLRQGEMQTHLLRLDTLVRKEKITDSLFVAWAASRIRYSAAKDLCLFPFMGRINNKIAETDAYFDFTGDMEPANTFVATLHSYADYADALASDLQIIGGISAKYAAERKTLRGSGQSIFPIFFHLATGVPGSFQRASVLSFMFKNIPQIPLAYRDSLSQYVSATQLATINRKSETASATLTELLQAFGLNDQEKQELQQLYAGTAGKVVFHDFWFFGCGPCMAEMPHYNQLIEAAGDSTQFIFLAAHTKKDDWQRIVQKYNLKGRHHLLSPNQLAFYERYFNVSSFPHHQMLNTKGQIVTQEIPHISPHEYDRILEMLEKVRKGGQ